MKKLMILSLVAFLILLQVARADITTDKNTYRPGETVNIQLSYSQPLTDVWLDIINPNGEKEASQLIMVNKSQDIWEYNYTLGTNAANGTYTINITASQGGNLVTANTPKFYFTKGFDVMAWKVDAALNKYHFIPNDALNLTVMITDRYSDSLTFDVSYKIQDPSQNVIRNESLNLKSVNQGFTDNFEIPENYTFGTYTIFIDLIDSDGRNASLNLNFSLSSSTIYITPDTINGTIKEITDMTIDFENFGDSDFIINEIKVPDNLISLISIVQRPYIISPNEKSTLKIRIDPSNSVQGTYTGVINVSSYKGSFPIYVNLFISSPSANEVPLSTQDYSFIIWTFAFFIVVVIIAITLLRYRKVRKKKIEEKKKAEKKKEDNYKPPQEEYRTEYY